MTIAFTTKVFDIDTCHYTNIEVPGHRDFFKNMSTGASLGNVAVIMVRLYLELCGVPERELEEAQG